jgi:hypothetical protein
MPSLISNPGSAPDNALLALWHVLPTIAKVIYETPPKNDSKYEKSIT